MEASARTNLRNRNWIALLLRKKIKAHNPDEACRSWWVVEDAAQGFGLVHSRYETIEIDAETFSIDLICLVDHCKPVVVL